MSWVVVKFLPSEEVEVLPASWYDAGKQVCVYPSYPRRTLEKAIRTQEKPQSNWKQYKVKLLSSREYDNFNLASAKASKACFTSDISDIEVLPQKRHIRKKVFSSSDEENDSDESLKGPSVPEESFIGIANKAKLTCGTDEYSNIYENEKELYSETSESSANAAGIRKEIRNEKEYGKSTSTCESSANAAVVRKAIGNEKGNGKPTSTCNEEEFRRQIILLQVRQAKLIKEIENSLNETRTSVQENKEILKDILNIVSNKTPEIIFGEIDVYNKLPIKTLDEVAEIESDLLQEQHFKFLVKSFERLGGADYKELIRRILTKTLNDEIMKLYSLHGHKGKKVFAETKLFSALTEAVKNFDKNVTIKLIETRTSACLAKASERLKLKEKHGETA